VRAIDDAYRKRLFTFSAMLCAIPLFLMPIAGRSSFEFEQERAAFSARFSAPPASIAWRTQQIPVSRDPFVPDPHVQASTALDPALTNRADALALVRAVVTGASPHALVEERGDVRVVGIGDPVAGSPVVAIDRTGLRLQNGAALPLEGQAP